MKKILIALTVLAFSAGLVGVASADGWSVKGQGLTGTGDASKMKWIKLATVDSTAIMLAWSDNSNVSAAAGTTGVLDIRQLPYRGQDDADDRALIGLTVWFSGEGGVGTSAAGDTVQIIPMYSYDGVTWQDGTTVTVEEITPMDIFISTTDDVAGAGLGAGMWRFRCNNYSQDSQPRQIWIKPFVYISKAP